MSEAFLANIDEVLTPEQREAWMRARMSSAVPESARLDGNGGPDRSGAGSSDQIAHIRINNNPYSAESVDGGNNEVIARGGVGDYATPLMIGAPRSGASSGSARYPAYCSAERPTMTRSPWRAAMSSK
jgi:hypothetical protein